jgi:soluble lytic murein transglycosylase
MSVAARRSARASAAIRRRRVTLVVGTAAIVGLIVALVVPTAKKAVEEVVLPLRHEDIIRQQARDKDLDPTLIAAVIYAESRFVEGRVSHAGAQGLMQITPATASDIARRSGGVAFEVSDLHIPQVNIAYGAYHLRYLLDRYGGNETLALAAYNSGEGNVDRWVSEARARDQALTIEAIPFGETREYVRKVRSAKGDYRRKYRKELGL